jgi:hypothetical protein
MALGVGTRSLLHALYSLANGATFGAAMSSVMIAMGSDSPPRTLARILNLKSHLGYLLSQGVSPYPVSGLPRLFAQT